MDGCQQFCRIRVLNTRQWRRAGVPTIRIRPSCIVSVCLDGYLGTQTRCVHRSLPGKLLRLSSSVIPGGNAIISLIFAEYLNRLFWHETYAGASAEDLPQWAIKLTAATAVIIVSVICVATPNLGPRTAVVFMAVKVRLQTGQPKSQLS